MNEFYFFLHIVCVLLFLFGALCFGKKTLATFVAVSWLFANFFVSKQILLFGFEVTASDVYVMGGMFGSCLLQEIWGRDVAKKTMILSFYLLTFAALGAFFHVLYTPSSHDVMHYHYAALFEPAFRLIGASLITFFIVQNLEILLFQLFKKFERLSFAVRSVCTICIVQFVDTLLFSFLGLYGLVYSLFDIILVSYLIKLVVVALFAPVIAFSKSLHKKLSYDLFSI